MRDFSSFVLSFCKNSWVEQTENDSPVPLWPHPLSGTWRSCSCITIHPAQTRAWGGGQVRIREERMQMKVRAAPSWSDHARGSSWWMRAPPKPCGGLGLLFCECTCTAAHSIPHNHTHAHTHALSWYFLGIKGDIVSTHTHSLSGKCTGVSKSLSLRATSALRSLSKDHRANCDRINTIRPTKQHVKYLPPHFSVLLSIKYHYWQPMMMFQCLGYIFRINQVKKPQIFICIYT